MKHLLLRTGPRVYHKLVILDPNPCPPDPQAVAEAYVMGTLSAEQKTAFEDHYTCCEPCATLLQKTAEYVDAMHEAAKTIRSGSPKSSAAGHSTES